MQLKPGSLLQGGKYRIEKVLGQGGFGITYLGVQTGLNRKVAIKEFFMKDFCNRDESTNRVSVSSQSGRELVERFRQKFIKEAQTIAVLENPHIVSIHDIFEENGTAYYVMKHVSGGSLKEYVEARGKLPENEALKFIRQIADALAYIHEQKILHLDVKPANVLLDERTHEAILIDFGISKHYDEAGGQTSSSPAGISKGYAPLEQYNQGGVDNFLPCTDIYSLGATLYFMLTGQVPPDASVVNDDGIPPLPSFISASTRKAIEQAMQPKRKERPQSVAAFLELLNNESISIKQVDNVTILKVEKNNDDEETGIINKPKTIAPILTDFYDYTLKDDGTYKAALTAQFREQLNRVSGGSITSNGYTWKTGDALPNPAPKGMYKDRKVTDMSYMFKECRNLISLDVSSFNTSNVTNMDSIFCGCCSLIKLDVSGFNTSKVWDMSCMFSGCNHLNSLDVSNFNTANVRDMSFMFSECKCLRNIDVSEFNTANVTNMRAVFKLCISLTNLDVSGFNTSKVKNMDSMFSECCSLKVLNVSKFDTANVIDMQAMFKLCSSLTCLDVSSFNTSNVISMNLMFYKCSSLASLDVSGFNTFSVTNMVYMFGECEYLTRLDLSGFNTSNVKDMSAMFSGCKRLSDLNIRGFHTVNVTNMNLMFRGCNSLTIIDIKNFNTTNVTDMGEMFADCRNLTNLDVSSFNTAKVTNMSYMFFGCISLASLDISSFQIGNSINIMRYQIGSKIPIFYMFSSCCKNRPSKVVGYAKDQLTANRLNNYKETGIDTNKLYFVVK